MKKYSHVLLAVLFMLVNDFWGMGEKKESKMRSIFTIEKIPQYLPIEEKNALEGIIKLEIKIHDFQASQENKIIRLDLSNNHIKKLNSLTDLLKKIPNLFFLHLNNCGIEDMTPLIEALPRLKKLYLKDNNIKKIPDLKKVTELAVLDLIDNKVEIDPKDKEKLKKIQFTYSVKQEVLRPEKKEKPETKTPPKKLDTTNLPLSLRVAPPKKNPLNSQKKLIPGVQVTEPIKQIGQKTRGQKRKNEALEDIQSNKRLTLNPSNKFIPAEKEENRLALIDRKPLPIALYKKNRPLQINALVKREPLHIEPYIANKLNLGTNKNGIDSEEKRFNLNKKSYPKNRTLINDNNTPEVINHSTNVEKNTTLQINSSFMNFFNKYKNWIMKGLTVGAVGASAYLLNRLKKQKEID